MDNKSKLLNLASTRSTRRLKKSALSWKNVYMLEKNCQNCNFALNLKKLIARRFSTRCLTVNCNDCSSQALLWSPYSFICLISTTTRKLPCFNKEATAEFELVQGRLGDCNAKTQSNTSFIACTPMASVYAQEEQSSITASHARVVSPRLEVEPSGNSRSPPKEKMLRS